MSASGTRIDLGKVSAGYAKRRAETPKEAYDDSAAQAEILLIVKNSAPSIQRANKILDVNSGNEDIVWDMTSNQWVRLGEQK